MFLNVHYLLTIGLVFKSEAKFSSNGTEESLSLVDKFEAFIRKYNKMYASETEKMMRFERFQQSLKEIDRLQKDDTGTATYGISQFSDLSREEFYGKCGKTFSRSKPVVEDECIGLEMADCGDEVYTTDKLPETFDWRDTQRVGPIRDQGFTCGACYAFAAVGVFDILYSVKHNRQYVFSVQQIIDCTYDEGPRGNTGCDGGYLDKTFLYINGTGLVENQYDIYIQMKKRCYIRPDWTLHKTTEIYIKFKSFCCGSLEKNMKKILQVSPIAVPVNIQGFQHYKEGIIRLSKKECKNKPPYEDEHHLMIIGYGTETKDVKNKKKKFPYWIVRNSHGPNWGEDGYGRVYRGENVCGIENNLFWAEV